MFQFKVMILPGNGHRSSSSWWCLFFSKPNALTSESRCWYRPPLGPCEAEYYPRFPCSFGTFQWHILCHFLVWDKYYPPLLSISYPQITMLNSGISLSCICILLLKDTLLNLYLLSCIFILLFLGVATFCTLNFSFVSCLINSVVLYRENAAL